MIDKIWWKWQNICPSYKYAYEGYLRMPIEDPSSLTTAASFSTDSSNIKNGTEPKAPPALLSNILDSWPWRVEDVMDTQGGVLCYSYSHSDSDIPILPYQKCKDLSSTYSADPTSTIELTTDSTGLTSSVVVLSKKTVGEDNLDKTLTHNEKFNLITHSVSPDISSMENPAEYPILGSLFAPKMVFPRKTEFMTTKLTQSIASTITKISTPTKRGFGRKPVDIQFIGTHFAPKYVGHPHTMTKSHQIVTSPSIELNVLHLQTLSKKIDLNQKSYFFPSMYEIHKILNDRIVLTRTDIPRPTKTIIDASMRTPWVKIIHTQQETAQGDNYQRIDCKNFKIKLIMPNVLSNDSIISMGLDLARIHSSHARMQRVIENYNVKCS